MDGTNVEHDPILQPRDIGLGWKEKQYGGEMMQSDEERIHANLESIGIRASGAAIGLFQLLKELRDVGVLGPDAIERIKEAVITDLALSRPRSQSMADYEKRVRDRMDSLLPINGDTPPQAMQH